MPVWFRATHTVDNLIDTAKLCNDEILPVLDVSVARHASVEKT